MRFMMMIKSDQETESNAPPTEEMFAAMADYNEEMARAGVLISGEGLHPSSEGVRLHFKDGKYTRIDGPFPDPRSLLAGYWLIEVDSLEDAIQWALRSPLYTRKFSTSSPSGGEVELELRQIFETEEFEEALTPELREREERLREQLESRP